MHSPKLFNGFILRRQWPALCLVALTLLRDTQPLIKDAPPFVQVDYLPEEFRRNFREFKVRAGGNSFYRSVSLAIFGDEDYFPIVRFATLMMVACKMNYFEKLCHPSFSSYKLFNVILSIATLKPALLTTGYSIYKRNNINGGEMNSASSPAQVVTAIAINRPIVVYVDGRDSYDVIPIDRALLSPIFIGSYNFVREYSALIPKRRNVYFEWGATSHLFYDKSVVRKENDKIEYEYPLKKAEEITKILDTFHPFGS